MKNYIKVFSTLLIGITLFGSIKVDAAQIDTVVNNYKKLYLYQYSSYIRADYSYKNITFTNGYTVLSPTVTPLSLTNQDIKDGMYKKELITENYKTY